MKLKDLSKDDSALTKKIWVVVAVLIMVAASAFAAVTLLTPDPPQTVSPGDDVSVDYIGFVNSTGTPQVFDTSEWSVAIDNTTYPKVAWFTMRAQSSYDPLNFTAGNGQVVIGFDQGVLGMEEGETKTIVISPEQGYGQIDTSKLVKFNLTSSVPLFVETTISLFKTKFGVDAVGGLTVQDNLHDSAFYFPAFEGCPAAAGELVGGMDLIGCLFIHFNPGLRLFGNVENSARVVHGLLDQIVHCQPSSVHRCKQEG